MKEYFKAIEMGDISNPSRTPNVRPNANSKIGMKPARLLCFDTLLSFRSLPRTGSVTLLSSSSLSKWTGEYTGSRE